ncbi:MAG: bifunctional [glutamate--ammonia ligase]-adenylyl-L-tyrosine phosphorylase/[glutamate--ammonia-ligase] adenylyltransferase, partial [Myxococcales bacterium]|nr:bifunctional [glutamate--ammonia ligase]-adenylyl-L-tyrosine phosphorylase/[glutamate--ammonia-ligase] adenylyltransferase [Myxococcales bacterium]
TDEAEVPGGEIAVHELYARVASWTSRALADATEDGFCFRVDLRLRPEGSRGALVNSLASAERYYETFGRPWERAALLRARPVAGDLPLGERLLEALRPFVFRREVDPGLAQMMGEMVRRSRRELSLDASKDVKLGRGGIREAEFFVQTLQLVWGGQVPTVRARGTIEGLTQLLSAGLVTDAEADSLARDWALLRRIEHRIQVWVAYQSHLLPGPEAELERFAISLGFEGAAELLDALSEARTRVAALFDSLDTAEPASEDRAEIRALCDAIDAGATARELGPGLQAALGVRYPEESVAHLLRLARLPEAPLGAACRARTPELGPLLLSEARDSIDPDAALRFLAEFFTRLGGGSVYHRLLLDDPRLARRLVGIFGASATLSSALVGHPEALDLLLAQRAPPDPESIVRAHAELEAASRAETASGSSGDPERFVAELRRLKRELSLQIGLCRVAAELDARGAERLLSELAVAQVRAAFERAYAETCARLGEPQRGQGAYPATMCVVAMGKLGAEELGFGGDLDLVFLYGADGETRPTASGRSASHAEVFARTAQRTMRLLSQPDAEGGGYQTDTRLRPSGAQGLLVVSLDAFDRYHARRAQAWERQALIKARPIAGDPALHAPIRERFAALAYEGGAPPAEELAAMRERMERELAQETAERYHPKLGYGGLVDVEFAIQWLQMRYGEDRRLRHRATLDALDALREAGLLGEEACALEAGYEFFRAVEQSMRLMDEALEPALHRRGAMAERLARALGVRARDGLSREEALLETWMEHARTIRTAFETIVAPVGTLAPWEIET